MLLTRSVGQHTASWLFIAACVCIQFRLLGNMLDGMVAERIGHATPSGRLFNEWPDRTAWTGITPICGGGLYMLWREATLRRSEADP